MSRIRTRVAAAAGAALLLAALAACSSSAPSSSAAAKSDYVTSGKLTVATGEPAYFPYVIDDKPQSGKGFESAVVYAVAEKLGFAKKDVVWVRSTFDEGIAPGVKAYDINIQQYSITADRAKKVDLSSSYYSTPQAVITVKGSKAASVSSLAGFKDLLVGAATGTTSFDSVEKVIRPTAGAQAFNSNDDAVLALKSGQIDALVVDLPTAFYLTGVELADGLLLGQLPTTDGVSDEWGVVLTKGSPLTAKVTKAIDALKADGTLTRISSTWLGADAGAPVLK
jgi:polar amino acid transport system substrate-binding protein